MTKYVVGTLAVLGFILLLILNPFVLIGTGERGIVLDFGAFNGKILDPGLRYRIPIKQDIVKMNVQTKVITFGDDEDNSGLAAASKDLQDVNISVVASYHVDASKVGQIYKDYGRDYEDNILSPLVRESVKSLASQYTAEELVTKRTQFSDELTRILTERFLEKSSVFDRANITNFQFSSSFNEAIEAKVTAEQNALAQKNKLEQVKYEAQQQIETAKAQAEAIKIQASAITSQGGADYVKLQWIKAWEKGGSKVPTFITGEGGANFLMDINQ